MSSRPARNHTPALAASWMLLGALIAGVISLGLTFLVATTA
jgi:hypothetical protein